MYEDTEFLPGNQHPLATPGGKCSREQTDSFILYEDTEFLDKQQPPEWQQESEGAYADTGIPTVADGLSQAWPRPDTEIHDDTSLPRGPDDCSAAECGARWTGRQMSRAGPAFQQAKALSEAAAARNRRHLLGIEDQENANPEWAHSKML